MKILIVVAIMQVAKAQKVLRGKTVDVSNGIPFLVLSCNFSFYDEESIRGFVAAFDAVCAIT